MPALISLIPFVLLAAPNQTFEVVDVSTTKVFAGKLGYSVTRTLTLSTDSGRTTVELPTYHDAVLPTPAGYKVGDHVKLVRGAVRLAN